MHRNASSRLRGSWFLREAGVKAFEAGAKIASSGAVARFQRVADRAGAVFSEDQSRWSVYYLCMAGGQSPCTAVQSKCWCTKLDPGTGACHIPMVTKSWGTNSRNIRHTRFGATNNVTAGSRPAPIKTENHPSRKTGPGFYFRSQLSASYDRWRRLQNTPNWAFQPSLATGSAGRKSAEAIPMRRQVP